jgi:LacI family transcriptional regulator
VEILQACHNVGLRVPEDIAVLGVDDDDVACLTARPQMSSIVLPTEAIGKRVATAIDEQLRRNRGRPFATREEFLPPLGITVRRSTEVLAIDDAEVVTAIRYIRENCHRAINATDVVRAVSVNRRRLERRFKTLLTTTISDEICQSRLALTKRLLVQTDHSMAKIASVCGYSDLRHLESVFKREQGLSPTMYRRRTRGEEYCRS